MTVIWKFLDLSWVRDIEFWEVIVIENLIKIQQMVWEGNLSCAMTLGPSAQVTLCVNEGM